MSSHSVLALLHADAATWITQHAFAGDVVAMQQAWWSRSAYAKFAPASVTVRIEKLAVKPLGAHIPLLVADGDAFYCTGTLADWAAVAHDRTVMASKPAQLAIDVLREAMPTLFGPGFVAEKRATLVTSLEGMSVATALAALRPVVTGRFSRRAKAALEAIPGVLLTPLEGASPSVQAIDVLTNHPVDKVRKAYAAMLASTTKFLEACDGQGIDPEVLRTAVPDAAETGLMVVAPAASLLEAARHEPALAPCAAMLERYVTSGIETSA